MFALAIAIGLAEYARGHVLTGLPWNLVGYGFLATLPLMQLAALLGVYALSFLAVLLFASPFAIVAPERLRARAAARAASRWPALLLLLLGLGYGWGERRLAARADRQAPDIRLRIVQANIDQADKWRPENSVEIFTRLSRSHQGRRTRRHRHRHLAGDGGAVSSRRFSRRAARDRRRAAGGHLARRRARAESSRSSAQRTRPAPSASITACS